MIARLAVLMVALTVAAAAQLPRIRLEPGDHLVYQRRVQISPHDGETRGYTEQVQLFVLERVREEWTVILEAARVEGNGLAPSYGCVFYVDPRGILRLAPETLAALDSHAPADAPWLGDPLILLDMFPVLPAALDNPASWSATVTPHNRVVSTTTAKRDGPSASPCFEYTCSDRDGVMELLRRAHRGTFCYDAASGLVSAAETEWNDSAVRYRARSTLFQKLNEPAEWLKLERAAALRYYGALRLEAAILDESLTQPSRASAIEQRVHRAWDEFINTDRGGESVLRRLARGRLARLPDDLPRFEERSRLAAEWLTRPAAHWSLQNLAGETVRSEDVRDRTTVELFWSARSAQSLRMFAALRALRAAHDEASLRIVCLNLDTDVRPARVAAEKLAPEFVHVFSGPPLRGDTPLDLPIIRVLDRGSRVLRIAVGARDDLIDVVKPHVR